MIRIATTTTLWTPYGFQIDVEKNNIHPSPSRSVWRSPRSPTTPRTPPPASSGRSCGRTRQGLRGSRRCGCPPARGPRPTPCQCLTQLAAFCVRFLVSFCPYHIVDTHRPQQQISRWHCSLKNCKVGMPFGDTPSVPTPFFLDYWMLSCFGRGWARCSFLLRKHRQNQTCEGR